MCLYTVQHYRLDVYLSTWFYRQATCLFVTLNAYFHIISLQKFFFCVYNSSKNFNIYMCLPLWTRCFEENEAERKQGDKVIGNVIYIFCLPVRFWVLKLRSITFNLSTPDVDHYSLVNKFSFLNCWFFSCEPLIVLFFFTLSLLSIQSTIS